MKQIITRFPPSPTGYLHVGGARTALFSWLYARHNKGKFILRIEDTDVERSSQASSDAILEALDWLGIDWDKGPYYQSERMAIYKEYIQQIVDSGHAYYCTCSPDDIKSMREKAMAKKEKPMYDRRCRNKQLSKTSDAVIRFAAPIGGSTAFNDKIRGNIIFQNSELDDFIICRSDGTPTYNIAVVVDDITMGVNTIIRGDDHINNTPKQILLYNAFKNVLPAYAHVPMVLGKDRTRLSKRHGAMSVTAYKDMGYLPDALLNYLVRLGWSYGNQEIFTKEELIDKFTLENIGRSAGVFDQEKLIAVNAAHVKTTSPLILSEHILPILNQKKINIKQGPALDKVIRTLNNRSKDLNEMADSALFYYQKNIEYDLKADKKNLKPSLIKPFEMLIHEIDKIDHFTEQNIENVFKKVMEKTGLKLGKIAQPLRVALTGKTVSPGIFEIVDVIGKKTVISRIKKAIDHIIKKNENQHL